MKFSHVKLCLGSASPRRAELLKQIGVNFEVCVANIDESIHENENAADYVLRMAIDKARRVWQKNQGTTLDGLPVLAADTAVVLGDWIMGKPTDREQGVEMLTALSGRTHEVLTSVSLLHAEKQVSRLSRSEVTFSTLSEADINRYWETGEPLDKAGAYAIQGKAAVFIELLKGSYSGVMGLPLFEVGHLLEEMEI
ncbi:MAG: Maf family protein [Acidiferrobacterales bacterium]